MTIKLVTRSVWKNSGNRGQRLQRMVAAVNWQIHKRLIKKAKVLRLASGRNFLAHPDCVISSALIYADYPEYDELRFIRCNLRESDTIIDVGANVGHIGLLLSDIVDSSKIYAFEPTPLTFARLLQNWDLNPDASPPHLYQMAVGDQLGEVLMPDRHEPNTMNAIVSAEQANESGIRVVQVPITTLDSFEQEWRGKKIGLLKIDVEGHEDAVFEGARSIISSIRPRLIMFESLSGTLSPVVASVLSDANFDVFQLEQGKPEFARQTAQNLFACPSEESEQLRYMK